MNDTKDDKKCRCSHHNRGASGAIYGLGVIGAAVYYMQHATTFMLVVIGLIKAIGWPAFLLYRILELLKM